MTMKPLNSSSRMLALATLLLVGMLDVLLWRTSSPFITEANIDHTALVITGGTVAVATLIVLLRLDHVVWPAVLASIGALIGTSRTMVTFSGTGGFQTIDGQIVFFDEVMQKPLPGPSYALIGIAVGLLLYFVSYKIRDMVVRTNKQVHR